jgi:glycosyltransferase involved in cell wall biosynthesis
MLPVSIVIPTYRREQVLADSIRDLLALPEPAAEIVVVDQTAQHESATETFLREREAAGQLRLVRLAQPSITAAMNAGLVHASQPIVLFLDDDIRPDASLVAAHWRAHQSHRGVLVAGRVLQPWDRDDAQQVANGPFLFSSTGERWIDEFMGGNFSVERDGALAMGGFDENFVRVAYRFEAEFAHRWRASGRRVFFEPQALIHHLKAGAGGTRTFGDHLTTWRADHAVGAYYWALRTRTWREFARRPLRSVVTRFHLRRPWRIPATLAAELGGMLWAIKLHAAGPRRLPGRRANGT